MYKIWRRKTFQVAKIKYFLFDTVKTKHADFISVFSRMFFGEQNIQLNWVEYAGSLVFAKQFRLPVFLLCYIYSIVKFLIQRPREPNQGSALPPTCSHQAPGEKGNFLGCNDGLFSQDYIHTTGKTLSTPSFMCMQFYVLKQMRSLNGVDGVIEHLLEAPFGPPVVVSHSHCRQWSTAPFHIGSDNVPAA